LTVSKALLHRSGYRYADERQIRITLQKAKIENDGIAQVADRCSILNHIKALRRT
jgi:hypothetical protein